MYDFFGLTIYLFMWFGIDYIYIYIYINIKLMEGGLRDSITIIIIILRVGLKDE